MSVLVHSIITTPQDTIYEELIDLIEQAETADRTGHPVDALIALGNAQSRIQSYRHEQAN